MRLNRWENEVKFMNALFSVLCNNSFYSIILLMKTTVRCHIRTFFELHSLMTLLGSYNLDTFKWKYFRRDEYFLVIFLNEKLMHSNNLAFCTTKWETVGLDGLMAMTLIFALFTTFE